MTVTSFLLSLTVKEFFWKSVNIWWSYGREFGVLFFLTPCVVWHNTGYLDTICCHCCRLKFMIPRGKRCQVTSNEGFFVCVVHRVNKFVLANVGAWTWVGWYMLQGVVYTKWSIKRRSRLHPVLIGWHWSQFCGATGWVRQLVWLSMSDSHLTNTSQ